MKSDYIQLELFTLGEIGFLGNQAFDIKEEWFVLTVDAPWSDLLLEEIKLWETRPTGTSYPKRIFIHTSQKKLRGDYKALAQKYLGKNYQPNYGQIIGTGVLTKIVTMTPEFIKKQPRKERRLGLWEPGRKAWKFEQLERILPIKATGCQGVPWSIEKSKLNPHLRQQILEVWKPNHENSNLIPQ